MEQWNLLVCQLENLLNLDCFIHSNHAKVAALSGVESPIFGHKHSHGVMTSPSSSMTKEKLSSRSEMSPMLHKGSDRISNLSVNGKIILLKDIF